MATFMYYKALLGLYNERSGPYGEAPIINVARFGVYSVAEPVPYPKTPAYRY